MTDARYRSGHAAMPAGSLGIVRRTTIELGPLRITREHHLAAPIAPLAQARPARPLRAVALVGIVCAASAGGLAVAATKVASPLDYSISRPVPAATDAPSHRPVARSVQRGKPAPAPARAVDSATEADADAAADASGSIAADRRAAIAMALRTGEVQEWQDPVRHIHGYVVAGAAEQADGQTCRLLSVLTRSAVGTDSVDQRRDCRPSDG